jgi:hypothetical protein
MSKSRYQQAKEERSASPEKRDAYLQGMKSNADRLSNAISENGHELSRFEYDSFCEELEYYKQEAIGVEGVDF